MPRIADEFGWDGSQAGDDSGESTEAPEPQAPANSQALATRPSSGETQPDQQDDQEPVQRVRVRHPMPAPAPAPAEKGVSGWWVVGTGLAAFGLGLLTSWLFGEAKK